MLSSGHPAAAAGCPMVVGQQQQLAMRPLNSSRLSCSQWHAALVCTVGSSCFACVISDAVYLLLSLAWQRRPLP